MSVRAFIASLSGLAVTGEERAFFGEADPWGFILFRRNVGTPEEVRALTDELRSIVGWEAPVLIDQEGGRVQRLAPPHWPAYPPAREFGRLAAQDAEEAADLARLGARLIAHDLHAVGVTVDCLPVLDVPVPGAHGVIGDRAYADDPATIARLGRAAAEGLLAGGVLPVIKHIPGHGRATADSHEALPVVETGFDELEARDFVPFRALADLPLAMTAHVVYTAIDSVRPATTSPVVFERVIRGSIGYDGLVMSDDVSMRALCGSFEERTRASIAAGCDLVLHCSGSLDEGRAVAAAVPELAGAAKRRAEAALARLKPPEPFDPVDARMRLNSALAAVA